MSRHADIDELFKEIREIEANNPGFDSTFVDSVEETFLANDDLSDRQMEALENIIAKWRPN